jgi:hypothetical protein
MTKRLSYIAVEGPHDTEFIARILKRAGFNHIKLKVDVCPEFKGLTDLRFPVADDLTKRIPVPYFYETASHAIAIHSSEGESKLAKNTIESLDTIGVQVSAVGFVMDDDDAPYPPARLIELKKQIREQSKPPQFTLPTSLGSPGIVAGPPKTGVYILPDNQNAGSLEDILLECAGLNYLYPTISASRYLASLDRSNLSAAEQKTLTRGSNPKKAHLASLVSVLRPGKSMQVSIHDNRWLDGDAINAPSVAAFRSFLRDLLDEPTI